MQRHEIRRTVYQDLVQKLSKFEDIVLLQKIAEAEKIHKGIGGTSVKLVLNNHNVFVKLVPLTDLEHHKNNLYTTKNIFNLPLYYQYGVGSTGFGVWRELKASQICSAWVIERKCSNFPVLYHHRILPAIDSINYKHQSTIEHSAYWESNKYIKQRHSQILNAKFIVALFFEYIPYTLFDYIFKLRNTNSDKLHIFTQKVLLQILATTRFLSDHNIVHFDAHFHNILTDGNDIYFADHGLTSSLTFELSEQEQNFLLEHRNLDQYFSITNLLHSLTVSNSDSMDDWTNILTSIKNRDMDPEAFLPFIMKLINQYGDLAVAIDGFYTSLRKKSKSTQYPGEELEKFFLKLNIDSD